MGGYSSAMNKPHPTNTPLRRGIGEMKMDTLKDVLVFILAEIKEEHASRWDGALMSDDRSNICLANIFHEASNKLPDLDFNFIDDERGLSAIFGLDGFHAIRDAECGEYQ